MRRDDMRVSHAVRFNQGSADYYKFVHGKSPRGVGAWSFSMVRNGAWTTVEETGSFADARRAAMRTARELGCSEVIVNT